MDESRKRFQLLRDLKVQALWGANVVLCLLLVFWPALLYFQVVVGRSGFQIIHAQRALLIPITLESDIASTTFEIEFQIKSGSVYSPLISGSKGVSLIPNPWISPGPRVLVISDWILVIALTSAAVVLTLKSRSSRKEV